MRKKDCKRFGFYLNGLSTAEIHLARRIRASGQFLGDLVNNTRGAALQSRLTDDANGVQVIGGKQLSRYAILGEKGRLVEQSDVPESAFAGPGSILVQNIVAHIKQPVDHIKITAAIANRLQPRDLLILDTINQLTNQSTMSNRFFLGLLHSRVVNWYVYRFIFGKAVRTMHFDGPVTGRIPIPVIDFANHSRVRLHDEVCDIVERMQNCQPVDSRGFGQKAVAEERDLDHCVYKLYGLTREETKLIDAAFPSI